MTKIKICGLFRFDDVIFVNEAMPDYAGFVFAKSHRQISHDMALWLSSKLNKRIIPVGVFANAILSDIVTLLKNEVIRIVQLHGGESEDYIHDLKSHFDVPIIKASNITCAHDIALMQKSAADYLLLDSGGGTGQSFDWELINQMQKPFFLAGGINISNIESALALSPFGIDVSSGVETDGLKDKDKIVELVKRVRHTK